jgi:hypothetical protein
MRGIILWLLGVPLVVIILLWPHHTAIAKALLPFSLA